MVGVHDICYIEKHSINLLEILFKVLEHFWLLFLYHV